MANGKKNGSRRNGMSALGQGQGGGNPAGGAGSTRERTPATPGGGTQEKPPKGEGKTDGGSGGTAATTG